MKTVESSAFLANSLLFRALPSEALCDIAGKVSLRQYSAGDMIVWQGEPSTAVYLIKRGIASLTRLAGNNGQARTLAYLMPGQSFGEVGILEQQPRSASVVALTNLEVLAFQRDDFLAILHRYPSVAIALAQILGAYLVDADRRQLQGAVNSRLILVFGLGEDADSSTIGHAIAATLVRKLDQPTAYTIYPDPAELVTTLGLDAHTQLYHHPAGYDIVIPDADPALPSAVRATLLLDMLLGQYSNTVVALPATLDANLMVLLEHAAHLVLLAPATAAGLGRLRRLRTNLARFTASGRIGLSVVAYRRPLDQFEPRVLDEADYDLARIDQPPANPNTLLPQAAAQAIGTLTDRIDHTHQLAMYIPTTIAVDQQFDSAAYVERALAFLGTRFGGATSKPASGVWRSEMVGLVSETVHLVQTYATEAGLNMHLDAVLNFMRELKRELQQEAMTIELDQKLILI